jgi:DNA polymerase I-like protein with 3'-5' exonuclease and polymerase domains
MGEVIKRGILDDGLVIPLLQIHDELVVQIRDNVLMERAPLIYDCMVIPYADMEIPPDTDPESGPALGSLSELSI